jgi:lipopolysaccharide/colanic/teichoic acid biosynthesis glycosyltransferase
VRTRQVISTVDVLWGETDVNSYDREVGAHDQIGLAPASREPARARVGFAGVLDHGAKRTIDIVVSLTLLLLLSPVIVACIIAIRLESPGPAFYRAPRAGRGGRVLFVLKFRKMVDGASGQPLTGNLDPRFTRIGRFLSRTKLDELPQLWNVLWGGMSLVGPRPEDSGFVALYEDEFRAILSVRPGVTGLCQLAFAREAEILDPDDRLGHYVRRILPQKVALDLLYVRSRTVGGDLRILVWTVLPLFLRVEVAVNRETGTLNVRRR